MKTVRDKQLHQIRKQKHIHTFTQNEINTQKKTIEYSIKFHRISS